MHLDRKKQGRTRQAFRILRPEVTLVEVESWLAIQFEQNVSGRSRHLPPRSEQVPSAGAAVTDSDCLAVKADSDHHAAPRTAIASDKRFREIGAVASKSSGQWNAGPDRGDHAVDEFAAVDVQTVGQNENAGEIVRAQGPANSFAAGP